MANDSNLIFKEIIVLHLLSKKKNVLRDSFKITKKVAEQHDISLDVILDKLISEEFLLSDSGKLSLTDKANEYLKTYNCFVIMFNHPEFDLSFDDFQSNSQWHTVKDNDIVWGIFNKRILEYTHSKMWGKLECNYSNMATLLIDEAKYEQALDFIFASAFLSTSGMCDENIVTTHMVEIWNSSVTNPLRVIIEKTGVNTDCLKDKYLNSKMVLSLLDILPFYYYNIEEACLFMLEALAKGDSKGIFTEQMLTVSLPKNKPNEEETERYFYNSTRNQMKREFGEDILAPNSRNESSTTTTNPKEPTKTPSTSNGGCYVATCVYGSYDCPEVWTLRRYRDDTLGSTWYGRLFIKAYYSVSPTIVKWLGKTKWFKRFWRVKLDKMVENLQSRGVECTPYSDREWDL